MEYPCHTTAVVLEEVKFQGSLLDKFQPIFKITMT